MNTEFNTIGTDSSLQVPPGNGAGASLAWRLCKRKERGVYAASVWDNPRDPAKFQGGGRAQTVKRPEGRAPAAMGAER